MRAPQRRRVRGARAEVEEEEAGAYRAELGLHEASLLARAAALRPGCVGVVEEFTHVHSIADAVRRALLLAVRGASCDACLWLHLHVGHADVLPRCGLLREAEPSFVYKYVDPWTDWGAALLFVASLQDVDVCALVALTAWLDADGGDASTSAQPGAGPAAGRFGGGGGGAGGGGDGAAGSGLLSADVAAVRARFERGVAAARASVDDVAGFNVALDDYLSGGAVVTFPLFPRAFQESFRR